jgi:hypothetical protein
MYDYRAFCKAERPVAVFGAALAVSFATFGGAAMA